MQNCLNCLRNLFAYVKLKNANSLFIFAKFGMLQDSINSNYFLIVIYLKSSCQFSENLTIINFDMILAKINFNRSILRMRRVTGKKDLRTLKLSFSAVLFFK